MAFDHKRVQGYPWDSIVVIWAPSDCLALYDGYLGDIDGFCSADVIGGNRTVSDLVLLDGFLKVCVDGHPISCCNILASFAPLISLL